MKKLLSFVISVSMTILSLFCGCSENSSKADKSIVETTKATEQQTTEQTTTVAPTTLQPTTTSVSAVTSARQTFLSSTRLLHMTSSI